MAPGHHSLHYVSHYVPLLLTHGDIWGIPLGMNSVKAELPKSLYSGKWLDISKSKPVLVGYWHYGHLLLKWKNGFMFSKDLF